MIPDDEEFVMTYTLIENKLYNQLRTIVNEPIKDDEIAPFKNVKRLFRACTNTALIESRGLTPVKTVIDSLGGWPVVDGDSWDEHNNWTWQKSMIDSVAAGYPASYLFTFKVEPDSTNTTKRAVTVRIIDEILKSTIAFNSSNRLLAQATRPFLPVLIMSRLKVSCVI